MKKMLSIILLFISTFTYGQVLEATSARDLINKIESSEFTYKGRGIVFGFNSTESCLFVSEDMAILKNYCYPSRNYPARGYTIISKEFGMIDLYEEKLPDALKRDIRISEFPEIIRPYLTTSFPDASVMGLSQMIEKLYYQFNPGCWSTNYGWENGSNITNCSSGINVINFDAWSQETQQIVSNEKEWLNVMKSIALQLNLR
jgi:hypothetical protein